MNLILLQPIGFTALSILVLAWLSFLWGRYGRKRKDKKIDIVLWSTLIDQIRRKNERLYQEFSAIIPSAPEPGEPGEPYGGLEKKLHAEEQLKELAAKLTAKLTEWKEGNAKDQMELKGAKRATSIAQGVFYVSSILLLILALGVLYLTLIDPTGAKLNQVSRYLLEAQSELKEAQDQITALASQIEQKSLEIANLEVSNRRLQQETEQLQANVRNFRNGLEALEGQMNTQFASMNTQFASLAEAHTRIEKGIMTITSE